MGRRAGGLRGGCLLLLPLWLLFAGQVGAATLPDMLGRPVAVPEGSLRLVSLAPSLTEAVFALGRGDWLAAVTDFCDYPPAARAKPRVGGTATPNLERILQVRPDLVLTTAEGNSRETLARLERLGLPVFALKPDGYAGILASIQTLGRLLRAEAAAEALVSDIQARIEGVRQAVAGRPRPRVLYLLWAEPLIAAGPATFIHDLLTMAGGENIVRNQAVPYPRLSWEEVVGGGPEVILLTDHRARENGDQPDGARPRAGWTTWRSIPAVRSGRVLSVPGDTILRPGPRVGEGVERLARAIHPAAFGRRGSP